MTQGMKPSTIPMHRQRAPHRLPSPADYGVRSWSRTGVVAGLLALAGAAPGVELPITAVTISPGGAVVTRSGPCPVGDQEISGLPCDLDAAGLTVAVAGQERPDWRYHVARPSVPGVTAPAQLALDQAHVDVGAADLALGRAQQHAAFARLAAQTVDEPATAPGAPPRALPLPADDQAVAVFVRANLDQAGREEAAALAARDLAVAHVLACEEALAATPAATPVQGVVAIGGAVAAGAQVTLSYRIPQAHWAPRYRLEVDHGAATLVEEAEFSISAPVADGAVWAVAPLAFTAREADRGVLLPELEIPVLGAAETVGDFTQPGRHRALARGGGTRASESSIDAGLRYLKRQQRGDGACGAAPWAVEETALALLAFEGAGYDHCTPSKYKATMQLAKDFLVAQDRARLPLAALALTTSALAEALAMTSDQTLVEPVKAWTDALRARAFAAGELLAGLSRSGPFAGPELAFWVECALASATAANVSIGDAQEHLRALLPAVQALPDVEVARVYATVLRQFLGDRVGLPGTAAQILAARAPRWLAAGRTGLVHAAALACFRGGEESWRQWSAVTAGLLSEQQIDEDGEADGSWKVDGPERGVLGTAQMILAREIYYRYRQVGAHPQEARGFGDVVEAARHWPVRLSSAGPVALRAGARQTIELRRVPLAGVVGYSAMPVLDDHPWRSLPTRNPLAQALPEGAARIVVDGQPLGWITVPFTPPGAAVTLPFGREERVRVVRTATQSSDDGLRIRHLAVAFAYRLEAPPGWSAPVTVVEPMPQMPGSDFALTVQEPPLAGEELQKRLDSDPLWRLTLTGAAPVAIRYELRYPASLRPSLEVAP